MLQKLTKKAQKGFTIIEVMIVLAIAGLIMVVVLIAIPQLQRNQRDTAKQNVAARLLTEMGTFATNNNGQAPTTTARLDDFQTRYASAIELNNPQTGNPYGLVLATDAITAPTIDQIVITPGSSCSGESITGYAAASRQYSVRILLERAGTFACVDNN